MTVSSGPTQQGNFYASPEYLSLVADAFFAGRKTSVEDVRIADHVLRMLVVDGKQVVTEVPFLDYHEPLTGDAAQHATRTAPFARWVSQGVITAKEWSAEAFPDREAAPYVDWTSFPTFKDYLAHVMTQRKGLMKEQERRRRRLADDFGELTFQTDDKGEDVLELARAWKSQQLRDTGANDWFSVPANVEFLKLAAQRGAMISSTLRAGGRLLSVWMGFIHDGVWSGWVFAFDHDPKLKKYSVGQQLLRSMLEESHARGHRQFDFSIGGEDYKWMYATHARLLGSIGTAPLRERTVKTVKQTAKRALAKNPELLAFVQRLRRRGPMETTQGNDAPKAAATSPPDEAPPASVLAQLKARASAGASAVLMPVVRRAGRAYVGGDTVHDALSIARRLNEDSLPNTLGFWDTVEYTPEQVVAIYVDAVKELAESALDSYLSIKPPALKYDPAFTAEVALAAKKWNVRVHCDSHGPETADASHALEEGLLAHLPPTHVSTTLPGRWLRSLKDADWAVEKGIRARVVKGQWPDPEAPNRDFSEGYLEVIDRLAGRARAVGVATHDVPLTEKVVQKLRATNTPFELELLYGMPMERSLRWANENKVPVRVYVPFGKGFLPSAVGVLRRNPRLAWLVIKDFFTPSAVRVL